MAVAFSTSDHITENILTSQPVYQIHESVSIKYDLDYCSNWITRKQLHKVALQFPDNLLSDSVAVLMELRTRTAAEFCITADTSYGSCCVDEIAAEHFRADGVIHFGHACLSPTRRLPVLYVFGKGAIDLQDLCEKIEKVSASAQVPVLLLADVWYHHCYDSIWNIVKLYFPTVIPYKLILQKNMETSLGNFPDTQVENALAPPLTAQKCVTDKDCVQDPVSKQCQSVDNQSSNAVPQLSGTIECSGHSLTLPDGCDSPNCLLFYIGQAGRSLTNYLMTLRCLSLMTYDPCSCQLVAEETNTNKLLMRRFYLVEKVKDAAIVGILVGTLGVQDYLLVIKRLKSLLSKAGKKFYTFVVGKLNVAKLANFPEVDVYVLVSCPENALFDSSEFYQPIVTPHEVELALNPNAAWSGRVHTDFHQILPGGQFGVDLPTTDIPESADMSMLTGGVRRIGVRKDHEELSSSVAVRNQATQLQAYESSAGDFLSERSWRGLEQNLGQTPVSKAVEGMKGIAASYQSEPQN